MTANLTNDEPKTWRHVHEAFWDAADDYCCMLGGMSDDVVTGRGVVTGDVLTDDDVFTEGDVGLAFEALDRAVASVEKYLARDPSLLLWVVGRVEVGQANAIVSRLMHLAAGFHDAQLERMADGIAASIERCLGSIDRHIKDEDSLLRAEVAAARR